MVFPFIDKRPEKAPPPWKNLWAMTISSPPKICVVVLNWNGWIETLACLESLLGLSVRPSSIVVVDNGSTDESIDRISTWAEEHFEHWLSIWAGEDVSTSSSDPVSPFYLIAHSANQGFSAGNNLGISLALAHNDFDFIWLLNNDTVVRPDALETLLSCDKQVQAGIYGSSVVTMENPDLIQCAGGCFYQPLTSIFQPYLAGEDLVRAQGETEQVQLDYIFGASLFARTEVFSRCGVLNEDYFLFYEEIDLCTRAQKEGFSLHWCKESVVLHKGGASVGNPEAGNRKKIAFANYHENLSTLLFSRKFYPFLLPFICAFRFFGKIAMLGRRGEWYLLGPLFAAYADFFTGSNQKDGYGK